jgi:multiple antibiotic resistance protein
MGSKAGASVTCGAGLVLNRPCARHHAMTADLRQLFEGTLLIYAALLPIVNPFGGAPVFLAMTSDCTRELRATLARRVSWNAFLLLLGSVSIGTYVLDLFGLSVHVVQVAGGIVVCAAGWDLLRSGGASETPIPSTPPSAAQIASRAFYPLTLPITVGPGSISVAITLGANHPHNVRSLLVNGTADLIGVTLIALTVFVCYRYADALLLRLGETGTSVLVRLSAFILFCIGVQIFWNGATALIAGFPATAAT